MVNQAIRNNPDKFPSGYVIELTNSEKEHVVKNFDHLETLKFSHATVKGFTEQGLYMLATILKSPMATATAIAIIDTFTQLRKLARTIDKVNEDAKEHGILPDKATEGQNICFFRYAFLVLGVSFVGNATSCLYSLTFSDSIQAQNLCKSLAGVRWFKVCRACMRKFCTKEKRGCVISHIPHALSGRVGNFNRTGRRSLPIYQLYSYSTSSQTAFIRKLM